jgi:hypothetical protein
MPLPHLTVLLVLFATSAAQAAADRSSSSSSCGGGERCGDLLLPFPFHLNSSCVSSTTNSSSRFRLSCDTTNATLTLPLGSATFRVLGFLPSGSLLLDYAPAASPSPSSPCDPAYAAFSRPSSPAAALDAAAAFLAVTPANVLRLYACEDSSLCRAGCEDVATCGRGGAAAGAKSGCCYPLSDGSVWKPGDGLGAFAEFGCRGFSSWVKNRSAAAPGVVRGIEVEWAVPKGSEMAACADGAVAVNATAVRGGVRCACAAGLVGDGFAHGTGCSKGTCKYSMTTRLTSSRNFQSKYMMLLLVHMHVQPAAILGRQVTAGSVAREGFAPRSQLLLPVNRRLPCVSSIGCIAFAHQSPLADDPHCTKQVSSFRSSSSRRPSRFGCS